MNFHLQKAGRSKCPRRRDFNSLYIKYCQEHFGGESGPEMFYNLEERINNFKDTHKKVKTAYQVYDEDGGAALTFVIRNPIMIRVHEKACVLVNNAHFFIFSSLFFPYHCSS